MCFLYYTFLVKSRSQHEVDALEVDWGRVKQQGASLKVDHPETRLGPGGMPRCRRWPGPWAGARPGPGPGLPPRPGPVPAQLCFVLQYVARATCPPKCEGLVLGAI